MNRCWLCTSFLTSHKIDCGVVAMVTKIAKMVYRKVVTHALVTTPALVFFFLFFLFFKPTQASKVNQRSRLNLHISIRKVDVKNQD